MDLATNLKDLIKTKGLTQKQIAAAINAGGRNYQRYEANDCKPPYEVLLALADFYDISLDYLVGRSDVAERR